MSRNDRKMRQHSKLLRFRSIRKYKDRMPNVEPRFAYNKHTLKYR